MGGAENNFGGATADIYLTFFSVHNLPVTSSLICDSELFYTMMQNVRTTSYVCNRP